MKPSFASIVLFGAIALVPAQAALTVGAPAPDFSAQAAMGGKEFTFSLADALKKGPVVLYFYPKSFTQGCTIEAHEFAEATDKFTAMGATLIGVSHDDIATQQKFSVAECRNKFAVAADPNGTVIGAYKAQMDKNPAYADRISYVITPDHKVAFAYADGNPEPHITLTMEAVKKWKDSH